MQIEALTCQLEKANWPLERFILKLMELKWVEKWLKLTRSKESSLKMLGLWSNLCLVTSLILDALTACLLIELTRRRN